MREKFELHSKTIGLVLFCLGVYSSLNSVVLLIQRQPDATKMIPSSALQMLSRSNIADMQATSSYVWKYDLRVLLLSGVAPILMGVYLMRSNNLFVRWCYPAVAGNSPAASSPANAPPKLNVSPKMPASAGDKRPDSRYAPPGYSE
jgi:hypothetical protein